MWRDFLPCLVPGCGNWELDARHDVRCPTLQQNGTTWYIWHLGLKYCSPLGMIQITKWQWRHEYLGLLRSLHKGRSKWAKVMPLNGISVLLFLLWLPVRFVLLGEMLSQHHPAKQPQCREMMVRGFRARVILAGSSYEDFTSLARNQKKIACRLSTRLSYISTGEASHCTTAIAPC